MIPLSIKVTVAMRERSEPRDMPQTPWPLVQPFPKEVPKPTASPPNIRSRGDRAGNSLNVMSWVLTMITLVRMRPNIKAILQAKLPF